jgi:cyclophilin family peptidyl-prolyl cis-trans isomerase
MTNRLAKTALLGIACIRLAPFVDANAARKEKVREEVAVVDTNLGKITFRFFSQESPKTVEAFKKLVRAGFYNGTLVHQVLPGLLIQAGDPLTRQENAEVPAVDVEALEIEKNDLKHVAGTVSMAHSRGDPTSRSEFFICLQEITYFDGKYTVIGEVLSGIKVVGAISQVPRNAKQSPLFPVRIRRISIETQEFLREVK